LIGFPVCCDTFPVSGGIVDTAGLGGVAELSGLYFFG
jgi:hypothetical protein